MDATGGSWSVYQHGQLLELPAVTPAASSGCDTQLIEAIMVLKIPELSLIAILVRLFFSFPET